MGKWLDSLKNNASKNKGIIIGGLILAASIFTIGMVLNVAGCFAISSIILGQIIRNCLLQNESKVPALQY